MAAGKFLILKNLTTNTKPVPENYTRKKTLTKAILAATQ